MFFWNFFSCPLLARSMSFYRVDWGVLEGNKNRMRGKVCWRIMHEGKREGEREREWCLYKMIKVIEVLGWLSWYIHKTPKWRSFCTMWRELAYDTLLNEFLNWYATPHHGMIIFWLNGCIIYVWMLIWIEFDGLNILNIPLNQISMDQESMEEMLMHGMRFSLYIYIYSSHAC